LLLGLLGIKFFLHQDKYYSTTIFSIWVVSYFQNICSHRHLPALSVVLDVQVLELLVLALLHLLVAPAAHPVHLAVRVPGCVLVGANLFKKKNYV
jgi:hypothetical protein